MVCLSVPFVGISMRGWSFMRCPVCMAQVKGRGIVKCPKCGSLLMISKGRVKLLVGVSPTAVMVHRLYNEVCDDDLI